MTEQPDITPLAAPWWRPAYRLRQRYAAAWVGLKGEHRVVTVPEGFRTDGSSEWLLLALGFVPAVLLWLFGVSQDGPHRAAAVVHDWLYAQRGGSRAEADWAFRQLALQAGMPRWRVWPRWVVLRLVGWAFWRT